MNWVQEGHCLRNVKMRSSVTSFPSSIFSYSLPVSLLLLLRGVMGLSSLTSVSSPSLFLFPFSSFLYLLISLLYRSSYLPISFTSVFSFFPLSSLLLSLTPSSFSLTFFLLPPIYLFSLPWFSNSSLFSRISFPPSVSLICN